MIALIDYGMGNLLSVYKALDHVGADVEIVTTPEQILDANAIVLPGVGNFGDGIKHLQEKNFIDPIIQGINDKKPFLGICLGMQLLMDSSEEAPGVAGLGVFKGQVIQFPKGDLKVPHMGWNNASIHSAGEKIFAGISDNSYFYFVHSFYVKPERNDIIAASCDYGLEFAAALAFDNVFATQFHPEKSQDKGLQLIQNFVNLAK